MKWYIKLTTKEQLVCVVPPGYDDYNKALKIKDSCLLEIAQAESDHFMFAWANAEVVSENWPFTTDAEIAETGEEK